MRQGLVAATALLCALAGCTSSGGTDPSDSPTPSLSPTTSAPITGTTPSTSSTTPAPSTSIPTTGPNVRPGETIPERPAIANDNSRAGAIALSTYWVRTIDWGYATTSSALARTVYVPSCADCAAFVADFDRARRKAYHFKDGRIGVQQVSIVTDDHRYVLAQRVADVRATVERLVVLDASGKTVASVPAVPATTYRVWMRWTAGKGQVIEFREVVQK